MNIMYCRHLLIKHTQSRNPSSWREKTITRTKEQAIIKLQQIRKEIVENGQDFIRLTMIESDCASAKYGGYLTGDINHFQKAFYSHPTSVMQYRNERQKFSYSLPFKKLTLYG